MPPTATVEAIKAYQAQVEKNQITPQNLSDCTKCGLEAHHFKVHAFRERRFLVVVDMTVQPEYASLVRFRCPACKKTVAFYPDFAIPHKHYTRQTMVGFAEHYLLSETATYQQVVMVKEQRAVPGYPDGEKSLAPSTVHRWVTTLSGLTGTTQKALDLIRQQDPDARVYRDLAQLTVKAGKYRTPVRKNSLLGCLRLLVVEAFFKATFHFSIFTNLARRCVFT